MLSKRYRYSFTFGVPEKSYSHPYFVVKYRKRETGGLKIAIVVSKKVDKSSVVRHETKRKFMEAIERVCNFELNYDIVFYLRKPVVLQAGNDLSHELEKVICSITDSKTK